MSSPNHNIENLIIKTKCNSRLSHAIYTRNETY